MEYFFNLKIAECAVTLQSPSSADCYELELVFTWYFTVVSRMLTIKRYKGIKALE